MNRQPDNRLPPVNSSLSSLPYWESCDGGTLVISCSGGIDSVVLAHATVGVIARLDRLGKWEKSAPQVLLRHLRHGIREEDGADARFVEELAQQLGVKAIIEEADVPAERQPGKDSLESAARRIRYSMLLDCMEKYEKCIAFTAHHADDNAETILFNLVRGTGPAGLRGISPVYGGNIHRPLLSVNREQIKEYAKSNNLEWMEDSSNLDTGISRNLIRHEVIPRLEQINPAAVEHINRLARMSREGLGNPVKPVSRLIANKSIFRELPLISYPDRACGVAGMELDGFDPLTSNEAVAALLGRIGARVDNASIEAICCGLLGELEFHDSGDRHFSFPGSGVVYWESTIASDERPQIIPELSRFRKVYTDEQRRELLGNMNLDAQRYPRWEKWIRGLLEPHMLRAWNVLLPHSGNTQYKLRTRRQGDRIQLPDGGTKKLGDVFTDYRIPVFLRDCWAVMVDGDDQPVWLPGLADSATMHRTSDSKQYEYMVLSPLK